MAFDNTWDQEDAWWRANYGARPYAAGATYEDFRPAYRYGYESGLHHMGRTWNDVESDLRTGWDRLDLEAKGGAESTWEKVKDAVQDAWNRVTGQTELDASKMSESEVDRLSHGGKPRK
jgi:hypothetical protein